MPEIRKNTDIRKLKDELLGEYMEMVFTHQAQRITVKHFQRVSILENCNDEFVLPMYEEDYAKAQADYSTMLLFIWIKIFLSFNCLWSKFFKIRLDRNEHTGFSQHSYFNLNSAAKHICQKIECSV